MDGYTAIFKTENTQGPTAQHRELYNVMWKPGWEEIWLRIDTFVCIPESLCCPPEMVTTWLIGHTPVQNKKVNFKKKPHQADRYSEQWLPEGRGVRWMKGVKGFKRYKLPVIK